MYPGLEKKQRYNVLGTSRKGGTDCLSGNKESGFVSLCVTKVLRTRARRTAQCGERSDPDATQRRLPGGVGEADVRWEQELRLRGGTCAALFFLFVYL